VALFLGAERFGTGLAGRAALRVGLGGQLPLNAAAHVFTHYLTIYAP
jgi:hypothetical protein